MSKSIFAILIFELYFSYFHPSQNIWTSIYKGEKETFSFSVSEVIFNLKSQFISEFNNVFIFSFFETNCKRGEGRVAIKYLVELGGQKIGY